MKEEITTAESLPHDPVITKPTHTVGEESLKEFDYSRVYIFPAIVNHADGTDAQGYLYTGQEFNIRAYITSHIQTLKDTLEGEKKKHFVFECNGAYGGKGCYETFCEDYKGECKSEDAKAVRNYNAGLDTAIKALGVNEIK